MMESFLDYIKSSREFLNNCLVLCDSLETDYLSNEFDDAVKDKKLIEMKNKISKIENNISVALKMPLKAEIVVSLNNKNGDYTDKISDNDVRSSIVNNNTLDLVQHPNNSIVDRLNELAKDAILSDSDSDSVIEYVHIDNESSVGLKDCCIILENSSVLSDSDKRNSTDGESNGNLIKYENGCNDIVNNITPCNNVDINNSQSKIESDHENELIHLNDVPSKDDVDCLSNVNFEEKNAMDSSSIMSEKDTLEDNSVSTMECSVIVEDLAKCSKDHILYKAYMVDLDSEIKRLSQIPKFTKNKSQQSEKSHQKQSGKGNRGYKLSKIFESDSDQNEDYSDSEEKSRTSFDNGDTMVDDVIISSTDSDSSTNSSKNEFKPRNMTARKDNSIQRRITRSLKIPIMSDSETSQKTSLSNGKLSRKVKLTKTRRIICESSDSENESDVSVSNLRKLNSKKRKQSDQSDNKAKRTKVDNDKTSDNETRKNIHKIMTESKLSEATKIAEQFEIERRKRMAEKQEIYNKSQLNKIVSADGSIAQLVLEKDQNGDSIVEVHEHIASKLKIHQIEAVNFMYDCVIENVGCLLKSQENKADDDQSSSSAVGGCIIAHCMGLGKTLALIAFIHTMLTTPILNLYSCVVVCPVNTALNWRREWEMWMPTDRPVEIFEVCTAENKKSKHSTILTWYKRGGVLIIGYEMFRLLASSDNRKIRHKKMREKLHEALLDPGADFIVCDEGHLLKNEKTAISKVINKVKTRRRIVLTGTPLQNKLIEYHTMVNFVKPNLLGTHKEFSNRFVNPITNGEHINSTPYDVKVMKKRSHILYKTLDGCVHRRDYSALVKYLPPKFEYVLKIRLSEIQMKLYNEYLSMTRKHRNSIFEDQKMLARIMTHPFVVCMHQEIVDKRMLLAEFEDFFTDDDDEDGSEKIKSKKKTPLDNTPINLVSDDSSVTNDKVEKMDIDSKKLKKTSSSNSKSSSEDEVVRKWSSCTRSNTRNLLNESDDEPVLNFELETAKDTPAEKYWWSDIIQPENEHQIEISGKLTILFQILRKAGELGDKVIVFSQSLLVLDILEKYLFEMHTLGEKVNQDLQKLNDTISDNEERKNTDFFSDIGYNTWQKGLDYDRMDGSTLVSVRANIQSRFNSEDDRRLRLFLISTRAGGMGVNLVSANRVVIFDVSWNPSHDIQAIFRSYRFGQNKPVYVYRLVGQATMEEKMYERQVTKLSLALRVVDEQQISRYFTEEDLRSLYKYEPDIYDPNKERETPILPKDRFLAELIQDFPQWIYSYHEHDSLLQNKDEEELTESERQEAWKEFEEEKAHGYRPMYQQQLNHAIVDVGSKEFAAEQMNMMHKMYPQHAAIFAQNYVNLLRYAVNQEPDLKFKPALLSSRMQAIFLLSLQKYKDTLSANTAAATATAGTNYKRMIAPKVTHVNDPSNVASVVNDPSNVTSDSTSNNDNLPQPNT